MFYLSFIGKNRSDSFEANKKENIIWPYVDAILHSIYVIQDARTHGVYWSNDEMCKEIGPAWFSFWPGLRVRNMKRMSVVRVGRKLTYSGSICRPCVLCTKLHWNRKKTFGRSALERKLYFGDVDVWKRAWVDPMNCSERPVLEVGHSRMVECTVKPSLVHPREFLQWTKSNSEPRSSWEPRCIPKASCKGRCWACVCVCLFQSLN